MGPHGSRRQACAARWERLTARCLRGPLRDAAHAVPPCRRQGMGAREATSLESRRAVRSNGHLSARSRVSADLLSSPGARGSDGSSAAAWTVPAFCSGFLCTWEGSRGKAVLCAGWRARPAWFLCSRASAHLLGPILSISHTQSHVGVHMHTHTHILTRACTSVHACSRVHLCVHMGAQAPTCLHTHAPSHRHAHSRVHTCICTRARTHTNQHSTILCEECRLWT